MSNRRGHSIAGIWSNRLAALAPRPCTHHTSPSTRSPPPWFICKKKASRRRLESGENLRFRSPILEADVVHPRAVVSGSFSHIHLICDVEGVGTGTPG